MKIQTKIALLFASLTAGILLATGLSLYYLINASTFEDFYKRLEIRAVIAAKLARDESGRDVYKELRGRHLEPLPEEQEVVIPLDAAGGPVTAGGFRGLPEGIAGAAGRDGAATGRAGSRFYYLLRFSSGRQTFLMSVSARNEGSIRYLRYLRHALLIFFPAAVLLAFTIGILFSKSILKPIRNITARVRNLSAENLHIRLEGKGGTDEIAELAATFNTMLDRLETAFESQNNFVSHASHEFNTPLTAIIGEAEFALARPRASGQYTESLAAILESADKLSGITKSLLQLAQTGMTGKGEGKEPLRIDILLQKVKEIVDGIIPENEVSLDYSLAPADRQKLVIRGNAALLELAVTNVVLNACKYSSNGPVRLAAAATGAHALILVKDQGIGIPKEALPYIYNPFFRAGNTQGFKGYGIGLPLTRNIVRLHSGSIEVASEEGAGTEIRILLPRSGS